MYKNCLQDAGGDTNEILACRKNLHSALGEANLLGGATAATFNVFLGTSLVALVLARVW